MKKLCFLAVLISLLPSARVGAWGFEAHAYITQRALDLLPAPLRPYYDRQRTLILAHVVDPDLLRVAGFDEEPPRHFLDLDAYGPFPFTALPREYGAAIEKFGPETLTKNGLLPWRTDEIFGRLVRAFRAGDRASFDDAAYLSALLAHYVADAYVPFHAVVNYDGQLTNQTGIHSRFESELFRRYRSQLRVDPSPPSALPGVIPASFETLLASFKDVEPVLAADRTAAAADPEYGDRYYAEFYRGAGEILQARVTAAISGVAAMIQAAWEQAGRPEVPAERQPRVRRR